LSAGDYWSSSNQLVFGNTASAANGGMTIATATNAVGQIYFADGTSGNAQYRGQIQYTHVSDAMDFATAATFAMRITSGGDVAIGGTSSDPLSLAFSGTGLAINEDSGVAYFQIDGGNTARIDFGQGGTRNFNIYSDASNYSEIKRTTNHPILFGTNNAERMRITSSGVLAIGKTSDDSTAAGVWIRKHSTGGHGQIMCTGSGSSAYEGLYVRDITNSEMEFMASYHGTLYYRALASLSDERKKDNIQNITLGLDAVKELRPVSFDWKNDKGNDQLGFIAQEVETTSLKQLVSTYKDENIEDLRRLNKEGLIPVLVKAIQELSAKVEELESKIDG